MLCPLLSSPLGQEYKEDLALSSDLFSKWPLLEDPYEKHFVQVKTHDVPTNPDFQFFGLYILWNFTALRVKKKVLAQVLWDFLKRHLLLPWYFLYWYENSYISIVLELFAELSPMANPFSRIVLFSESSNLFAK